MSVYKIKGKWKAEVWIRSKKVTTKSGFERKHDAQQWKVNMLAQLQGEGAGMKPKPIDVTFDELLVRYKEIHLPTLRVETQRRYLVDIEQRIADHFRYYQLCAITPQVIEAFRVGLLKGRLSRKSINNCMSLLKAILGKAVDWGLLPASPFRLTPMKVPNKKYEWWDEKRLIRRFLEVIKGDRYEAAYRLALECGLRLGEIVGLSKQDISFELGSIHIHRQWLDKQKIYGPTKQGRDRYVKFDKSSPLGEVLRKAVEQSPDREILFTTQTDLRVMARGLSGQLFKSKVKAAGLPNIPFHGLRHTFASWYMIEHDDIWSLMSILGHSNITTTHRYAHLSSKHQKIPVFDWNEKSPLISLSERETRRSNY
jgi:integrase